MGRGQQRRGKPKAHGKTRPGDSSMSRADKRFLKDFGEQHPVHDTDSEPRRQQPAATAVTTTIKRPRIDTSNDRFSREIFNGSRKSLELPKTSATKQQPQQYRPRNQQQADEPEPSPKDEPASSSDDEVDAVPNAAYSELLTTIKPRGRFAELLEQAQREVSDDDEEDDEEGSDDGEDEDEDGLDINASDEEIGDQIADQINGSDDDESDDEVEEELPQGGESEESQDDDDDDDDDDHSDGHEDHDGLQDPSKIYDDDDDDAVGVQRVARLRAHFDVELPDDKAVKSLQSVIDANKGKKLFAEPTEFKSEHFGLLTVTPGVASLTTPLRQPSTVVSVNALKPKLRWWARDKGNAKKPNPLPKNIDFTPAQAELFNYMDTYKDVYLPQWQHDQAQQYRESYALHTLNHVLKHQAIVAKNTARIKGGETELELRDQGFTRPRVLIVLPYRFCALKLVEYMIKLVSDPDGSLSARTVKNKNRFFEEFGVDPSEPVSENEAMRRQFDGNADDCFRVGVALTRSSLNLYSDFHNSDIIIASPLGLRMIIGTEHDRKKQSYDFLSSIEVLVFDQTDSFLMQNWSHVQHVMDYMNRLPREQHEIDISRIRHWNLEGLAASFRQTIIISAFPSPEINALWNTHCRNLAGRVSYFD